MPISFRRDEDQFNSFNRDSSERDRPGGERGRFSPYDRDRDRGRPQVGAGYGASINDVRKIFGFFDPSPLSNCILI